MKVFLSWSGGRSKALAEALRTWLKDVLQDVEPWMSYRDISAGSLWFDQLNRELDATSFGVVCLTAENIKAPWLLFEAGALSKSVETARVVPYCLGVDPTTIPPPLALFQGVRADKEGTQRLLHSINSCVVNKLPDDRLQKAFERWWGDLEKALSAIPASGEALLVKLRRAYCAYAAAYDIEAEVQVDATILESSFPGCVVVRPRVTKVQLEKDLMTADYAIVHLVLHTDPRSGDVFFDAKRAERMKADALEQLVKRCNARLVCLATCDSTVLGARLSRATTVIAAYGDTPGKAWIEWEKTFYSQLAIGTSVYAAFDLAQASSNEPMTLHRNSDAVFSTLNSELERFKV